MTKAMLLGCVVVLTAVIVSATPLAPSGPDDETCLDALKVCANQLVYPYLALNETDVLARIRNTPLYEHCSDLKRAGDCVREKIKTRSCSRINSTLSSNIAVGLEAHGFVLKYACTQHYYEISQTIQCLANESLVIDVQSSCTYIIYFGDPDKICESVHKTIGCTEAKVRTQCGLQAAILYKDFNVKLLEKFSKFVLGKDCSYKPTNQLELMKKLLSGE